MAERNDSARRLDEGKVAFVTCVNDEAWYQEARAYMESLDVPAGMKTEFIPVRQAASMCAGYEEGRLASDAKYKVYLHQDTLVVNKSLIADLLDLFADATIGAVGVIGCRSLPKSGIWWDGMRNYGRVLHACEPESVVDSECMEPDGDYMEVEAVDGLFIATQCDIAWRADLFTGWHLYDTSYCRELQRRGFRVVVPNQSADFWCIHCPKEKPLAASYRTYQKVFLREYGAELHPEV
ncbi:glycosyltransferase family protein [Mitsuokella sp. oral taxon 131]|mgnify:FL=1|uniref:glycosyltransferase family protein n=1 Tax=Mitsuokella sp. oral taxon 131 TaxID=1321780 RepID=UPI0003ADE4F4|nr:glycosyltransferase family protein [Mitsuokella sp. oral taxon 131]ERL04917.1 hypothetical protein HMPREF1985_01096 [Mitsuokella sp. oral taxon 131 str. W9106]